MNHQHVTSMDGWVLGLESTAHTLSFGAVQGDGTTLPAAIDTIRPTEGAFTPEKLQIITAMLHKLAEHLARTSCPRFSNLSGVAFSQGPGMGLVCRWVRALPERSLPRMTFHSSASITAWLTSKSDVGNATAMIQFCCTFRREHPSHHPIGWPLPRAR